MAYSLVFLFAGIVKGLVGFGMPTISLGLLTVFVGLNQAIVLILWPTLVTNIWQAFYGGHLRSLLHRFWPFFLASVLTLWFGTFMLVRLPVGAPDLVLGILMAAYAVPLLAGASFSIPEKLQTPAGVILGAINGVFFRIDRILLGARCHVSSVAWTIPKCLCTGDGLVVFIVNAGVVGVTG